MSAGASKAVVAQDDTVGLLDSCPPWHPYSGWHARHGTAIADGQFVELSPELFNECLDGADVLLTIVYHLHLVTIDAENVGPLPNG
jgi:hypothetical protein